MNKGTIPRSLAIHPSWHHEGFSIFEDSKRAMELLDLAKKSYAGPAFNAYKDGHVYEVKPNMYYSFDDGLLYTVSENNKRIVLLPLQGVLYDWKYQWLTDMVIAADADEAYDGLLIMGDSPGGSTFGMKTFAQAVKDFSKPLGVHVKGYLCSAAAYVTAPADFILADTVEKSWFGSIGVFTILENYKDWYEKEQIKTMIIRNEEATEKYKPNSYEEWEEDDIQEFQDEINLMGKEFHEVMKSGRKLSDAQMDELKTGKAFNNLDKSQSLGLHDGTATFDEAVQKVANYQSQLTFI